MGAIEETRRSEPSMANKKLTEEESAMGKPENNHHVRGRPRQPEESGASANGTLRYEAEAETWQCAQCEKEYAETDAGGAAAHVATHTKANQKKRRQQARKPIREMPIETLVKQEYAPCYNMGKKSERYQGRTRKAQPNKNKGPRHHRMKKGKTKMTKNKEQ